MLGFAPNSARPISSTRGLVEGAASLQGSAFVTAVLRGIKVGAASFSGSATSSSTASRLRRSATQISSLASSSYDGRRIRGGVVFSMGAAALMVSPRRITAGRFSMTTNVDLQADTTTTYLALLDKQSSQLVYAVELSVWAVSDRVAA